MMQLGYWTWSGTFSPCVLGVDCAFAGGGPPYDADTTFPYDAAVLTSNVWKANDSPAYAIGEQLQSGATNATACSSVTYGGWLQDFFIYQPTVPSSRTGQAIWLTTDVRSLNYAATATLDSSTNTWQLANPTEPSPSTSATALPTWSQFSPNTSSECVTRTS